MMAASKPTFQLFKTDIRI